MADAAPPDETEILLTKQQKKNRKKKEAKKAKKNEEKEVSTQLDGLSISTGTSHPATSSSQPADSFDVELSWCVEQLQLGLATQKPNLEQVKETQRIIRLLNSAKAPKAKKRQIMRSVFGDYRKKMEADAKQLLEGSDGQTDAFIASNSSGSRQSKFVKRKTVPASSSDDVQDSCWHPSAPGSDFLFNFPEPKTQCSQNELKE